MFFYANDKHQHTILARKKQHNTHRIKSPIINQHSLFIRDTQNSIWPSSSNKMRIIISKAPRNRIRQPNRAIHIPKQHICNRLTRFLSRYTRPHHRSHIRMFDPRLDHLMSNRVRDNDGVTLHTEQSGDKIVRVLSKSEVLPITPVPIHGDIPLTRICVHKHDSYILFSSSARCH